MTINEFIGALCILVAAFGLCAQALDLVLQLRKKLRAKQRAKLYWNQWP